MAPATVSDPRETAAGFVPHLGSKTPGRYVFRRFFDYQEHANPVREAFEWGLELAGLARGLGDLNDDGQLGPEAGDVVRAEAPTVHLDPASNEARRRGSTSQAIVTQTRFNARGQPTAIVDPEGATTELTYHPADDPDGDGVPVESTLPLPAELTGYLRSTIVDSAGAVSPRRTARAPPAHLESVLRYDPVGNVTASRDPRGVWTTFEVNALNEVLVVTRGADVTDAARSGQLVTGEQAFAYRVRAIHDANGRVTRQEVEDRDGTTTGVEDPGEWVEVDVEYDLLGNPLSVSVEVATGRRLVTTLRYDPEELVTLVLRPAGDVTLTTYDERDLPFTITRGAGTPDASTIQVDYDRQGNRKRALDAEDTDLDGRREETLFRHDGFDRLVELTDAVGNFTRLRYDAGDQLVTTQVFGHLPGRFGAPFLLLNETRRAYDELSRRVREDEPVFLTPGVATLRPVDLLKDGDGDGVVSARLEYDAASRPTFVVDDDGQVTETVYDGAGRAVETHDALGNRVRVTHDNNGNVVQVESLERSQDGLLADETFTARYVFDQLDRLVRATDNAGHTTSLRYDSRDQLVFRADPEGPPTYDPLGLVPGQVNAPGNTTTWVHDGLGRLLRQVTDLRVGGTGEGPLDLSNPSNPDGQVTLRYEWDDNSRPRAIVDDSGNQTSFEHDALDRQTAIVFADGERASYFYDKDDNLVRSVDAIGTTRRHTYDALHRLVTTRIERGPGVGGTTVETYQHDGLGRVTRTFDDSGGAPLPGVVTERVYDSRSRLVEERQDGQALSHVWAGDGKRLQCTYPGGRELRYTHDALDRVKTISDARGGLIARHDWVGPGGRLLRRTHGNGTVLTLGYDPAQRLERLRVTGLGSTPFLEREYGHNRAGVRTLERRHDDFGLTDVYTHDSAYRIVKTDYDQGGVQGAQGARRALSQARYTLDGVGNRRTVDLTSATGTKTELYTVNELNEYTSKDGVQRSHDDNGNLTGDGARVYVFDHRDRLVLVSRKSDFAPLALYQYDTDGRRRRKVVFNASRPGSIQKDTRFFWDGWQLVEEQGPTGLTKTTYVSGPGLDDHVQLERGAHTLYPHQNARGDVVAVTNAAGAVLEKTRYDDFGAPERASQHGNPHLFQGAFFDAETGFCYLRNRYYDPQTGRFLSRDPVWDAGNVGNQYSFVGNSPATGSDPLGLSGWLDGLADSLPVGLGHAVKTAGDCLTAGRKWLKESLWDDSIASIKLAFKAAEAEWKYGSKGYAALYAFGGAVQVLDMALIVGGAAVKGSILGVKAGAALLKGVLKGSARDLLQGVGRAALNPRTLGCSFARTRAGLGLEAGLSKMALKGESNLIRRTAGRMAEKLRNACFLAGTLVETQDGQRPIEEIADDEQVWSKDPRTGEVALKRVTRTFRSWTDRVCVVRVRMEGARPRQVGRGERHTVGGSGGEEGGEEDGEPPPGDVQTILCTPNHPFMVEAQGWTSAEALVAGDRLELLLAPGVVAVVEGVEVRAHRVDVFNLEVEGFATYFVAERESAPAVWVHNACDINVRHIFHGEVRSKTGKAVGFHHRGAEGGPGRIGSELFGKLVPGTKTGVDAHGVYKAKVEVLDTSTGNWVAKQQPSSFFPDAWSRRQVVDEVRGAFANHVPVGSNGWVGTSPSGVKIKGYLDAAGKIETAYPAMGPAVGP